MSGAYCTIEHWAQDPLSLSPGAPYAGQTTAGIGDMTSGREGVRFAFRAARRQEKVT
jgi:hypothetical protein